MPPAVRFIALTVSLSAYLGLAVLGAGGFAVFFSKPALIGLTVVLAALGLASFFAGGNLSPGEREDRSNRWVIPVFGLVSLALAYLPAYTDRIDFWTIDGDAVRWAGVALFAIGGALRLWPVFVLGDRFSGLVAIQPGTGSSPLPFTAPSATRAIWGFSSARPAGRWHLDQAWRAAGRTSRSPDHRANTRRGGVAANAVWQRIRRLSRPDKPPHSRPPLRKLRQSGSQQGRRFNFLRSRIAASSFRDHDGNDPSFSNCRLLSSRRRKRRACVRIRAIRGSG